MVQSGLTGKGLNSINKQTNGKMILAEKEKVEVIPQFILIVVWVIMN